MVCSTQDAVRQKKMLQYTGLTSIIDDNIEMNKTFEASTWIRNYSLYRFYYTFGTTVKYSSCINIITFSSQTSEF